MNSNDSKKLPVWMLTPKEEKQVFLNWRDYSWKVCDEYVQKFAECEQTAGMGVWFKCKEQSKAMRKCIDGRRQKKYVDEERDKFIMHKMEALGVTSKEQEEARIRDDTVSAGVAKKAAAAAGGCQCGAKCTCKKCEC